MDKDIERLTEALHANLGIVQALSHRIDLLEQGRVNDASRIMALQLLLRATYLHSPRREDTRLYLERMVAQAQVQPGVVLNSDLGTFPKMKEQLDWLTKLPPAAD